MTNHFAGLVCPHCKLYNESNGFQCRRCNKPLSAQRASSTRKEDRQFTLGRILTRIVLLATFFLVAWYASLTTTSAPLSAEQKQIVARAINILEQRGFTTEVFLLRRVTTFRATDHWWNQRFGHPQAYAATNFPYEVMTLYPEFFTKTADDTERAVILLHESYHLRGQGEEKAYAEVWREKERLGYTEARYNKTRVWNNMRDDTLTFAPELFTCGPAGNDDCLAGGDAVNSFSHRRMLAPVQREQQQSEER